MQQNFGSNTIEKWSEQHQAFYKSCMPFENADLMSWLMFANPSNRIPSNIEVGPYLNLSLIMVASMFLHGTIIPPLKSEGTPLSLYSY